jgi:hypothetical protein
METKTHEYLRQHQFSEISILDFLRAGIDKDDIINTIVDLYRKKQVVTSYGGDYPFHACSISVHPSKWEEYINTYGKTYIKSMYRNGIKKKEILAIREIMWEFVKQCYPYLLDEGEGGSYTHPSAWTFVRTTNRFE